jgi:SPP1 family predicted phage head-tail adaptor
MKKVKFGQLNKLVQLWAAKAIVDDSGGMEEDWQFVAELWAAIMPVRSIEKIVAFQEQKIITHRIITRFVDKLPIAKLRFGCGDRLFTVRHYFFHNPNEQYSEFWTAEERL